MRLSALRLPTLANRYAVFPPARRVSGFRAFSRVSIAARAGTDDIMLPTPSGIDIANLVEDSSALEPSDDEVGIFLTRAVSLTAWGVPTPLLQRAHVPWLLVNCWPQCPLAAITCAEHCILPCHPPERQGAGSSSCECAQRGARGARDEAQVLGAALCGQG